MRKLTLCFGLALVLALALAPAAFGQYLTELGPICTVTQNPDGTFTGGNGFPLYIGDSTGKKLDLAVVLDPVIPDNPFSVHTGFGGEGFYFLAESRMDLGSGRRALLVLGVEAAYGADDPMIGDQFMFVRTRIRIDTPVVGQYTVMHPWGTEVFQVVATEAELAGDNYYLLEDGINFTYDWGGFSPLCPAVTACLPNSQAPSFERILLSPKQGPFLVQEGFEASTEFLGDGVTEAPVTGSAIGQNYFRIEGPVGSNLDGQGNNFIQNNNFIVNGHIYQGNECTPGTGGGGGGGGGGEPLPADTVTVDRAKYNPRNGKLEIRATSALGLPMTAEWFNAAGGFLGTAPLDNRGRITVDFPFTTVDNLPANVIVSTRQPSTPGTLTVTVNPAPR